jgi:hypothetical protein
MGAFQATNLSGPPPQPPEVTGQQGGGMSGLSEMLANKMGKKEGPPGDMDSVAGVHPQGAMLALLDTIKKAANQLARMDEGMAPFVNRATSILEQGVGDVISKKKPAAGGSSEPGSEGPGISAKPAQGESSKGFPG